MAFPTFGPQNVLGLIAQGDEFNPFQVSRRRQQEQLEQQQANRLAELVARQKQLGNTAQAVNIANAVNPRPQTKIVQTEQGLARVTIGPDGQVQEAGLIRPTQGGGMTRPAPPMRPQQAAPLGVPQRKIPENLQQFLPAEVMAGTRQPTTQELVEAARQAKQQASQPSLAERRFEAEQARRTQEQSQAEIEAREQAAAQQAQGAVNLDAFNTAYDRAVGVLDSAIDEGFELFGDEVTGISGAVASIIPSSDRNVLEGALDTMKGLVGFEKLQKMREASPTGGALGQVSELELRLLNSTLGNIEPGKARNAADLKRQLETVRQLFARVVGGTAANREEHLQNIRQMLNQQEIRNLSNDQLLSF